MFLYLILLLTALPMLELFVLLEVHALLSTWLGGGQALLLTLGGIAFTGVLGATLARQQGLGVLKALRECGAKGQLPTQPIMDAGFILVGGALLLTPGFLTDILGFSFLIPFTRHLLRARLVGWSKKKIEAGDMQFRASVNGVIFDAAAGRSNMRRGTGVVETTGERVEDARIESVEVENKPPPDSGNRDSGNRDSGN